MGVLMCGALSDTKNVGTGLAGKLNFIYKQNDTKTFVEHPREEKCRFQILILFKCTCMPRNLPPVRMKAFLLGCLLATASVDAHRALLEGPSCFDDFKSSHAALRVEDPSISWYFDHYFDCRSRAVWLNVLANETSFYFGAAVTILERFQDVRASAVVIGPDLGPLSSEQISRIPGAVLQDDVFDASSALLLEAPQDQSTCNHIGATLRELYATVENNRCVDLADLRAWPVLDVENIRLTPGQEYHIAVFLQENESAKVTIGLGYVQKLMDMRHPILLTKGSYTFSPHKNMASRFQHSLHTRRANLPSRNGGLFRKRSIHRHVLPGRYLSQHWRSYWMR